MSKCREGRGDEMGDSFRSLVHSEKSQHDKSMLWSNSV